jgi:single-strand DNA-binding protein
MFNQVQVLGFVGNDPEIRSLANGNSVANFSIATSERWTDKNSGEKKELTEWHRCVVFGKTADVVGEYVKKGNPLFVTGRLRTEKFKDKEGVERQITKVYVDRVVLQPRQQAEGDAAPARQTRAAAPKQEEQFDDDIPF